MKMRSSRPSFFGVALGVLIVACGGHTPPPYDNPPVLANRDDIEAAMRAVGAGLEARVVLFLRIDASGQVQSVRVGRSSGSVELDDAAMWIGRQMRFEPARSEGKAVPALVEIPVTFDVVKQVVRSARLRNSEEIAARIVREHGDVRGKARFRILVGTEGWVIDRQDRRPFSEAAQAAARKLIDDVMFTPAYRGDRAIVSWVMLIFEFAGPETRVYIDAPGA
ncbi:MAG: energy transducer TonB [Gemmatimonadota bacterium]|nr:MAG: energy transducer TonB [Gemmatimonadota bacterium]